MIFENEDGGIQAFIKQIQQQIKTFLYLKNVRKIDAQ